MPAHASSPRELPEAKLYRLASILARNAGRHRPELIADTMRLVRRLEPCRHTEDFASVVWYWQKVPPFTGTQAEIVRILWEAWENGTPDVRQLTILLRIGSVSEADDRADRSKIKDIFGDHPAWGTMIGAGDGRRGSLRLMDGAIVPAAKSNKAKKARRKTADTPPIHPPA